MKPFVNPEEAVRRRNLGIQAIQSLVQAKKAQVNAVKDARMRAFQYAVAQAVAQTQTQAHAQVQAPAIIKKYTFVDYKQVTKK
jgi:hypothetical protein